MKQLAILLCILCLSFYHAQDTKKWRNMKPEQRKELIKKMDPSEREALLKKIREEYLMEELQIPQEKQNEFKDLYSEYQESQKNIKEKFKHTKNYSEMSDDEAQKELEKSFEVGQQLLENRKKYSEKFRKVVKPQQVLELFQNEGMMRNKMLDKKREPNTSGRTIENSRTPSVHRNNATRNNGTRFPNQRP